MKKDIWLGIEACPCWLVHPAVQGLPCGAAGKADGPEHGSPSCGLAPCFVHREQQGELPHPLAAQEGLCSTGYIAPEIWGGVWGETGELGFLASVPQVGWTADTEATSQTQGPGNSTEPCLLS